MANLKIVEAATPSHKLSFADVKIGDIFSRRLYTFGPKGGWVKNPTCLIKISDHEAVNLETGAIQILTMENEPVSLYKGYLTIYTNDFITTEEELSKYS